MIAVENTEIGIVGTMQLCAPSRSFIDNYMRNNAAYEPHLSPHIMATLRPGSVFVDVGANVGYYSVLAAQRVGGTGTVVAIEPDGLNARCLVKTRALNSLHNLAIWPVAAAEIMGSEALLLDDASNSGVRDLDRVLETDYHLILGLPLDTILARQSRVDVIKIDIEGREFRAMRGAVRTLMEHQPIVFSEFNPDAMPDVSNNTGLNIFNSCLRLGIRLVSCG